MASYWTGDKTGKGIPVPRLSREDSGRFAAAVLDLRHEHRAASSYELFLQLDYSRSTVHRWLNGSTRIPLVAASRILEALHENASRLESSPPAIRLRAMIEQYTGSESRESALRSELRARGIPVGKTIAALKAAGILSHTEI